MNALEAVTLLQQLDGVDLNKIAQLAAFVNGPQGQALASQISSMEPSAAQQMSDFDEAQQVKAHRLGLDNQKDKSTLGLLRTAMGASPKAMLIKAALAAAGETFDTAGDIVANNYNTAARNTLVGTQTDASQQMLGTGRASAVKQISANNKVKRGQNIARGLKAVGNVVKNVTGVYNTADNTARMMSANEALGGGRMPGYFWLYANKLAGR